MKQPVKSEKLVKVNGNEEGCGVSFCGLAFGVLKARLEWGNSSILPMSPLGLGETAYSMSNLKFSRCLLLFMFREFVSFSLPHAFLSPYQTNTNKRDLRFRVEYAIGAHFTGSMRRRTQREWEQ